MKNFILIIFCFLIASITGNINQQIKEPFKKSNQGTDKMNLQEMEEKILLKDWDALNILDSLKNKEQAIPVLSSLLQNTDREVREIALNCFNLIANKETAKIIIRSLQDEDVEIRFTALQIIQSIYSESIINELIYNLKNENEVIRKEVALIIGKIGIEESKYPLSERLRTENHPDVKRAIQLALARLGDQSMKDHFVSQLKINDSKLRLLALEDIRYINDRNLVKKIMPALDDYGKGYLISHKTEDSPRFARVCDAAVTLIAQMYDKPFTFEVSERKIYNEAELKEARKFLESLDHD